MAGTSFASTGARRRGSSWARAILLVIALAGAVPLPAMAARDLFRVTGVPVDATAENAVAARAMAIEQGEREGLAQLLRRLTLPEDVAALPDVGRLGIERYVRSFDIASEQVAPTRYIASLNVTYDPPAVERLLAGAGVPAVLQPPPPVLLVPALRRTDGTIDLWGEDNPWRAAWAAAPVENTLVEIVLPLGDLEDVSALRPDDVAAGNADAAFALANRYGVQEVVVAVIDDPGVGTEATPAGLRLEVRRLGDPAPLLDETVAVTPGATPVETLAGAVTRATTALDDGWKRASLVRAGPTRTVAVEVPLADLAGLVHIRRGLESLAVVRRVRVDALERSRARLIIEYAGDLTQLGAAVTSLGLVLSQESDAWRLLPAGDPRDRVTPSVTGTTL